MVNIKGNENIVRDRVELGQKNKEDVYNAVHELTSNDNFDLKEKVRLEDIWNYLEEKTKQENEVMKSVIIGICESEGSAWTRAYLDKRIEEETKKTISIRTIQRCIDRDSRIKKDAWYFYIDDETRFEKRYLHPSLDGRELYEEFRQNMSSHYRFELGKNRPMVVIGRKNGLPIVGLDKNLPIEDEMKHLVTEIGFFVVYSLIDACRPFRDKSLSLEDREDLVRYWIKNSIPISTMLDEFLDLFKPDYNAYENHLPTWDDEGRKKGLSVLEMDEETIQNTLIMLQKQYPLQFKIMLESSDPRGLKRMGAFAYKDGNLIYPKKVKRKNASLR